MRAARRLCCLALCFVLPAGCSDAAKRESTSVFAMDTVMDLTAYGPKAQKALDAAEAELHRLDALLSVGRSESDISKVNAAEDGVCTKVSDETAQLVRQALELCEATGGALDITVYPAMEAWGFPSKEYRVPDEAELTGLQTQVDYRAVEVNGPGITHYSGKLDLGAVGKGYAGDRVIALWKDMGLKSGLLSLGGNVQCLGAKPDGSDWTVAVRDPADENGYLATVTGHDMAVVTSGAYQRYFEQNGAVYHHILDPKTCAPAESGLASVTIVTQSGLLADGLSTAVYVMGLDRANALWRERGDFEMILYTDAGEIYITAGLQGRVTPAEGLTLRVIG